MLIAYHFRTRRITYSLHSFYLVEFLIVVFQIYVNNKAQIDPVLDQVKAKLTEVSDKVTALMPQAKAVAAEPKKEE